MIIGFFKEYRGYRGTIEHTPSNMIGSPINENESKINDEIKHKYRYYGRIIDVRRDDIFYYSNDLISMHKEFINIVDNYLNDAYGVIQCDNDKSTCRYLCDSCEYKVETGVHYEKMEGSTNIYIKTD